jgi:hypothetical protein
MIFILFLLVIQSTVYCQDVSQFTSLGESFEQFLGPENWGIAQALPCGDQTEVDNEMFELAVNGGSLALYVFERLPNCEFEYRFRLDSENDRMHRQAAVKTSLVAVIARGSEAGKIIDKLVITTKGQRWDIQKKTIAPEPASLPSLVATENGPAVQSSQPIVQPAVQPSLNAIAATERASQPSLEAPIIPPSSPDSKASPPIVVIAANQQTSRTGQATSETSKSLTRGNSTGLDMTEESAEVSQPPTSNTKTTSPSSSGSIPSYIIAIIASACILVAVLLVIGVVIVYNKRQKHSGRFTAKKIESQQQRPPFQRSRNSEDTVQSLRLRIDDVFYYNEGW